MTTYVKCWEPVTAGRPNTFRIQLRNLGPPPHVIAAMAGMSAVLFAMRVLSKMWVAAVRFTWSSPANE